MIDTTDLKNMIQGLEGSLKTLQGQKDQFVKAQGLNEEAEKLNAETVRLEGELVTQKETLKGLVEQKNKAIATVTGTMAAKMNDVLPAGEAALEIGDGGTFFIGWKNDGKTVPYSGLSGGEKASFEPALCRALGGTVLVVEAAELDGERLTAALEKYAMTAMQVIASSCHEPASIPDGWQVVRL